MESNGFTNGVLLKNVDKFLNLKDQDLGGHAEKVYDGFADIYDEEMEINLGAQGANVAPVVLKQYLADSKNIKILDVAAGTGNAGAVLNRLGFKDIDALDVSTKMLEKAKDKKIYNKLIAAPVTGKPTPGISARCYDAIICTHAFSFNQLPATALDEFTRIVKQGGLLCFTAMKNFVSKKECGFLLKISELVIERKMDLLLMKEFEYLRPVEKSEFDDDHSRGYVFVCKVL